MSKKVFITGGSGFLGRNLISFLKKKKAKIFAPSSKELNLLKHNDLKKLKNNFDTIYHLAAWTQAGDFCLKYPMEQWVINQEINTNIIKYIQINKSINQFSIVRVIVIGALLIMNTAIGSGSE